MTTKYQPVDCIISPKTPDDRKTLKVTVIGDSDVGITCMLATYLLKKFPSEAKPTIIDKYTVKSIVEDEEYDVSFWNISCINLRILNYRNVNCVLVCFSVNNRTSFTNVLHGWLPEIKKYCQNVPVILVGTKSDLRLTNDDCVTSKEANIMKERIGAIEYIECSALADDNLQTVFEKVIQMSIRKEKSNCIIL